MKKELLIRLIQEHLEVYERDSVSLAEIVAMLEFVKHVLMSEMDKLTDEQLQNEVQIKNA